MQSRFAHPFGPSRKPLRVLAPVLAAGALGVAAALPVSAAGTARVHAAPHHSCASASDVTLDFVAADINDVLKALALETRSNIVSATDVKGTITVSLAHVTLENALNVISKLSGYQYAKVGGTYIVGSAASVASLSGGTDAGTIQTAVIPFTYANADDIGNIIKQLVPNIKITPGKAASGPGGVFVVSGTQADLDQVRQIVGQAEAALSKNIAESQTVVYNIKYASPDDLQAVINRLVPNVIVTPGPTQGFRLEAPTTADSSGVTSSTTSYGATATGTGGTVTSVTSSPPTKATTTSLLLTGSVTDIARAQQVLAQVDTRPLQINYEAKVVEVSLNKNNELGLTYDFSGAHTTIGEILQPGDTATSTQFTDPYPGHILKGETFGRTPLSQFVTAQLHALFTSGDAKLLASPNISAVDGQPAATFVGDTVSYISSVTQSPTGQNITTSTVNAGIKLFVTGKVNNDGYITMNVHPEVSLVTLSTAGAGGVQVPDVRIREATTTVQVRDGDTVAIGGLINDQDVKNIQKVPILGDLPFFGALFRDTIHNHTRDEVVIYIKVSIQKDKPAV